MGESIRTIGKYYYSGFNSGVLRREKYTSAVNRNPIDYRIGKEFRPLVHGFFRQAPVEYMPVYGNMVNGTGPDPPGKMMRFSMNLFFNDLVTDTRIVQYRAWYCPGQTFVIPGTVSFSMRTTSKPLSAISRAVVDPAGPAPITATSDCIFFIYMLLAFARFNF